MDRPTSVVTLVASTVAAVVLAGCSAAPPTTSHAPTPKTVPTTTVHAEACDTSGVATTAHVGGARDLGNSVAVTAHVTVGAVIAITASHGLPIEIARVTGPHVLQLLCDAARPHGIVAVFRATSTGDTTVDMNSKSLCPGCAIHGYTVEVTVAH